MYFLALATDYDGTIASDGVVDADTLAALEVFKATGRKLILVTGRDLPSLKQAFPNFSLFDRIVAENGALLYDPGTEEERVVAPPIPAAFIESLRSRGVSPLSVGRSIVATWKPNETVVLEVIQQLGLELQIIFNKGAVMVLPAGVNKASGLNAALRELNISILNVVGVGDAENDHAFLQACGCAGTVANALPALKERSDIRLERDHGAGVAELMEMIIRDDSQIASPQRRGILLGSDIEGGEVYLEPHAGSVLIAGSSGVGKSTLATALTERMVEKKLGFCIFDPEGDYAALDSAVSIGGAKTPPDEDGAIKLLTEVEANVVINTQALALADRPLLFAKLLPQILSLRARTGRPHWLLVDEAHHLMTASRADVSQLLPDSIPASILITVHPDAMSPNALRTVEYVIAVGKRAGETIDNFCKALGEDAPRELPSVDENQITFWDRKSGRSPYVVNVIRPTQVRDRHKRKYAEGELDPDLSFYFRGPDRLLNLRAQNLMIFMQIAQGIDEKTWQHHLRAGDYSRWFRDVIKDGGLAEEAAEIEQDLSLAAAESLKHINQAISRRYTASAHRAHNWRDDAGRQAKT